MQCDSRKVGIIGLGKVGITAAYALILRHTADEIVLVSRSLDKVMGEKLDLEHGLPFLAPTQITASTEYSALEGSDVILICAGVAQKPGESRLDLIHENQKIMAELAPQLKPFIGNSVVVVVSNPVDVLTYQLAELLDLPYGRVLGTGTMLDTARFRYHLGEVLEVHPRSIHAYVMGEHGDSSFPAVAHATVGGQALAAFPNFKAGDVDEAFLKTKEAAAQIIKSKGATYYAIGVVISQLTQTILENQRSVLPVSTVIKDYYGQSDLAISVPCIIGRSGVEKVLKIQLSEAEQALFVNSCQILKKLES